MEFADFISKRSEQDGCIVHPAKWNPALKLSDKNVALSILQNETQLFDILKNIIIALELNSNR